nr:MAG TPA: Protein fucoxanthin chlorophyl a/c protein, Light-harvesting, Fucoxanthin, Diatom [Caudoviricetes sp.]
MLEAVLKCLLWKQEERNGRLSMISSLGLKVNLSILDVHASGMEVKEI